MSSVWKDGIFDNKVVFCTGGQYISLATSWFWEAESLRAVLGRKIPISLPAPTTLNNANANSFPGAGTICSAQVRAMVHLGANAMIIGRNVEKTETMAKSIATARKGAKVIGIGAVDVRKIQDLESAVARCVKELGGIDYVM